MVLCGGFEPYTVGIFRRFGGRYCFHLLGDSLVQMGSEALDIFTT
jgi:hypothetical protein